MLRERSLWALLAVLVVAGVVAGHLGQRESRIPVALAAGLPEPVPTAGERRWQPFPGEEIASRRLGAGLGRPGLLTAGGGDLYLVDYADMRVKALDGDLRRLRMLGPKSVAEPDGVGGAVAERTDDGTWRTRQPMDLAFAGGRLWLSDPQTRQVLALTPGGDLVGRLETDTEPFRLAAHADGAVTVLVPNAPDHVFETFAAPAGGDRSPPADPLRRFGTLVDPELQMPWTLDGFLLAEPGGGFVYTLRHRALIAAYDPDGRLRYLVEPVAEMPEPVMIEDGTGGLRGDGDAPFALLDAEIHGDTVYVLTTEDGTAATGGVVDLYAAADGAYLHSWRLPEGWHSLAIAEDRLHALTAESVKTYRW